MLIVVISVVAVIEWSPRELQTTALTGIWPAGVELIGCPILITLVVLAPQLGGFQGAGVARSFKATLDDPRKGIVQKRLMPARRAHRQVCAHEGQRYGSLDSNPASIASCKTLRMAASSPPLRQSRHSLAQRSRCSGVAESNSGFRSLRR